MNDLGGSKGSRSGTERWIAACGTLWIIGLPLAVLPGLWEEFRASKTLFAALVATPLFLLAWRRNLKHGDPARGWRRLLFGSFALLSLHALWIAPLGGDAIHSGPSFSDIARFAPLFLGALATLEWAAGQRWNARLIRGLGMALGAVLAVGLLKQLTGWPTWIPSSTQVAFAATIGNSNELAEWAAPLAVLLLLAPRVGAAVWTARLAALAALSLVFLSESRGGALSLGAGLLVGLIALFRSGASNSARTLPPKRMLAGLGLITVALFALPGTRDRALSVLDGDHGTNRIRVQLWESTWDTVRANPWTGVGLGGYEAGVNPYRRGEEQAGEWARIGVHTIAESPHQEFLWILAILGLPGLLLIAAVGLRLTRDFRAAKAKVPAVDSLLPALLGGLVAFVVLACIRSPLHHASGVLGASLITGLLVSYAPRKSRRKEPVWLGATYAALLLVLVLGSLDDLRQDRFVASVRDAKAAANASLNTGDRQPWTDLGNDLRRAAAGEGARDWRRRARLIPELSDAARLRVALERGSPGQESTAEVRRFARTLPGYDAFVELAAATLDAFPAHVPTLKTWLEAFEAEVRAEQLDLYRLRDLLARTGWAENGERVPPPPSGVRRLGYGLNERLESALRHGPNAPELRRLMARWALLQGESARAIELLREESARLGDFEVGVALELGRTQLRTGQDPSTFGRWLDLWRAPPVPRQEFEVARQALADGDPRKAYTAVLSHPRFGQSQNPPREALSLLADSGYRWPSEDSRTEAARIDADLATARLRLALAREADAGKDLRMRAVHLRFARRKDPALLDAIYLHAAWSLEVGRESDAAAALARLERAGITEATLDQRLERDGFQKLRALLQEAAAGR